MRFECYELDDPDGGSVSLPAQVEHAPIGAITLVTAIVELAGGPHDRCTVQAGVRSSRDRHLVNTLAIDGGAYTHFYDQTDTVSGAGRPLFQYRSSLFKKGGQDA